MKLFLSPVILFLFTYINLRAQTSPSIENGVSYELAKSRKNNISEIQYNLYFYVPENKADSIVANEQIKFNYKPTKEKYLQIDFKEKESYIKDIVINHTPVEALIEKEHIIIDEKYLRSGENIININFRAGDGALNRREDYLYTLFVPDRARTVFPCFDQPDLKARFQLSLTIPKHWTAIANGNIVDSSLANKQKTYHFKNSDLIPTYLFSFAAGKFRCDKVNFASKEIQILYRETDSIKIKNSLDSIFKLYTDAVNYYEKWTTITYPFQKNGMVAIPDFQFGGMEHPGAILLQNNTLFLDNNATQNQINNRSNLIAHEVAHMWFGDLVTMNWFTDVWMKEVFANYMADKSTGASSDKSTYDLKFLTTHFPSAYNIDRTLGANPIRQPLDNLQNAGMLYGPIIYDKAPIMMHQLELLMGSENFQNGVRDYLKKYAYKNASWPDLIECLSKYTKENLITWNNVWVNKTSRPIVNYNINYKNNKIETITISQEPEMGKSDRIWKQQFEFELYYKDSIIKQEITLQNKNQNISILKNKNKPLFTLLNANGIGYGNFQIDTSILNNFTLITNPLSRASTYISLYENMLNGNNISPNRLLNFLLQQLNKERVELNLKLITNYINTLYWEFLTTQQRSNQSTISEQTIWNSISSQNSKNNKKLLFELYENIFQSNGAYNKLYQIWNTQTNDESIVLNDEDYTSLSLALALRSNENESILVKQLHRIKNTDRINRYKILMQATSSDPNTRKIFFDGLSTKSNRINESAITSSLYLLHHPLRQQTSIAFLPKTLELLPEIQKTGDIFFPDNWLRSTFSFYQNPEALRIVKMFLIKNGKDLNPVLRNKVLQATDNLRHANKLIK